MTSSGSARNDGDAVHDLRPVIDRHTITGIIDRHFDTPVRNVEQIEGGQVARIFAFSAGPHAYILRINRQLGANVEKEVFLARLLADTGIPIPELLFHGRVGELHYGIARRLPGTPISVLERREADALVPALLDLLDVIHAVDVSGTTCFATVGNDGNGLFQSWAAWLTSVREEEPDWDFYGTWHHMFETTFLGRNVFDAVYARMVELLPYCPEDRYLIHGNFGFSNVLVQDRHITAVLDWQEAGYGDFMYDIAHLDFWDVEARWAEIALERYRRRGLNVMFPRERICCYQRRIALDAMKFFAKSGDEGAYRWINTRIERIQC